MKFLFVSLAIIGVLYFTVYLINRAVSHKDDTGNADEYFSKRAFTACRGVAIVLIMLGHLGNQFGIRYLTPLGSWGVAMFLLVSGFGLEASVQKKGLKGYWFNRFLNAYLPYALFEIFGYIFLYQDIHFTDVIKDLLLIDTLHPFGWYMQCLFLYYIGFYLFSLVAKEKTRLKITLLCVLSVCIFILTRSLFRQQLFSFTLGVLLFHALPQVKEVSNRKYVLLSGSCLFLGITFLGIKQIGFIRDAVWVVFDTIAAFQTIFLGLGSVLLIDFIWRNKSQLLIPFYYVGIISFEIYLVHGFMILPVSYASLVFFFVATFFTASVLYILRIKCLNEPVTALLKRNQ